MIHGDIKRSFRDKAFLAVLEDVDRAGWRWRDNRSKGGHIVIYPPDGSRPIVLSTTAYAGRGLANIRSTLRRLGLQ